jgi:hypothetical protein
MGRLVWPGRKLGLALLLLPFMAWGAGLQGGPAAHMALAEEADGGESGNETVRRGVGDLFQAAKSGHPSLLQDAEREIVSGLMDGLEACASEGKIDAGRYEQVLADYDSAKHLFRELPYTLEVDPGNGLRPFSLPLRRHPWWDLTLRPPHGWQAVLIESGARLVAVNR